MGRKCNKEFIIKEDGTIVRSDILSSKIETFKKKISHKNEVIDDLDAEEDDMPLCPECFSDDVTNDGGDFLQYMCNECGHFWGNRNDIDCPKCGSQDVMDDGGNYLQFECNNCGHIWGDEDVENDDDIICCPECGSVDITDDGSGYLQYECGDCGHIWGDEDDVE